MTKAEVTLHRRFRLAPVPRRLFGSFVEHMACDLLEYANVPSGTALSDLRAKHGAPDPYGIRLWS